MFRALKIINSEKKKNIRFVAAGSYQIEFFEHEGNDYFTIYRFNYGGDGQGHYYLLNLGEAVIKQFSATEIQIMQGHSTYKLCLIDRDGDNIVNVTRYLWGWLPLSKFSGKASKAGLAVLISSFKKYTNDSVA